MLWKTFLGAHACQVQRKKEEVKQTHPYASPPVHQEIGPADSNDLANPELLKGVLTIGFDCNPQPGVKVNLSASWWFSASTNVHTGLEADKGIVSKWHERWIWLKV